MIKLFLLAILVGFMLRFLAKVGVFHYARKSQSDEELKGYVGFHLSIFSYLTGTLLKYGGFALLLAHLVKEYLLT